MKQTSPRGAISTSHHLATEAGAAALRAGGNAIDAALAAAATLCVVYPHNVALGGDLVALVHTPDGETRFLNATGTAPADQKLTALREKHGDHLPVRGVDTVTVPGGIRGWQALHELGAMRSWADHLEAATRYAAEGVPVAHSLATGITDEQEPMLADPGCRQVFFRDGAPLAEGDLLRQPRLADTLRRLAENGPDEFYTGETAERWVSGLRALGSKISMIDAADYSADWGSCSRERSAVTGCSPARPTPPASSCSARSRRSRRESRILSARAPDSSPRRCARVTRCGLRPSPIRDSVEPPAGN